MKTKSIKDTVHGYIRVDYPFWHIIDAAEFQRLKWIEQTSYRVLYPSARHDRFIHSVGVYHLGKKAANGLLKNSSEEYKECINKYKNSFLLACLLHDIGHAPFSHTCEDLYSYQYKLNDITSPLNTILLDNLKGELPSFDVYERFKSDFQNILKSGPNDISKVPAPHEIMSAILVVQNFSKLNKYFSSELDLDLIVRAIIGCTFELKKSSLKETKKDFGVKNTYIRLLNSSTVDVDKLDYIARDTRMSGFDNIVIDTERLLDSVCFVENSDGILLPAYKKSALSVIENVIIAKNSQAQWIVQHPVVLYDAYLLRRAVGLSINRLYKKNFNGSTEIRSFDDLLNNIFSAQSLSKQGKNFGNLNISLLSDVDILYWMKQGFDDRFISEYFARDIRKHPIWKSHSEFIFYLDSNWDKAKTVADYMAPLCNYIQSIENLNDPKVINSELIDIILQDDIAGADEIINIIKALLEYKNDNTAEYCILEAKSSFSAILNDKHIYVRFGSEKQYCQYSDLFNKSDKISENKYQFFYLYSNKDINPSDFLKYLFSKADESKGVHV